MSNIAKRIAGLSPERRELLARLLQQEQADAAPSVIAPRSRELMHLPLSFAQQRLWFLQQLKPDSPFYNIPDATYFDGPLDITALEKSFGEIVRRHEALRTTFQTIYAQPAQVVAPPAPVRLEVVDLSRLPAPQREPEAQRLADEEGQKPFDLSRDQLLRLRLLKLDEARHILLITMHHIISDGWSLEVLARELSTLYAAFREGRSSPLAELPVQYADFAIWQRKWLTGEALEEQLRYWREQLGGELPVLELPADRKRPAMQSFSGAVELRELGERLTRRLKELGREAGATLFMTLLAAFNALLARYSQQDEIVVGTPIAGRNRAEIESLIGFFVNTLALRTDLSGDPTFLELLARTRETTLGAYAHQDVPFEKLVEELQPERRADFSPLFQVVFTVQNAPAGELKLAGTDVEVMPTETATAKFDLRLAATETGDTLALSMRYSTELFDAARIRRMLGHFERLLESIVADPSRRLSQLSILDERERRKLLAPWPESREEFAVDQCLHEMFAAQARKTPEAVALVCEHQSLTYGELDARSNSLAHRLRDLGVGPETLVGMCVGRSLDMLVGVLGILKAGGAYLPLEPEYPAERLAFMLADARVRVMLTESSRAEKFAGHAVEVVCLDAIGEGDEGESVEPPESGAGPDNLAYVIYTSGSTGRPKGTLITHRNVARLFAATRRWFNFDERDVWTLFHSYAFDVSVWEMWGALLHGGRLVVVPYAVSRSPAEFYELLLAEQVTVLSQTPSAFRQLLRVDESNRDARPHSLRLIVFGGEVLEMHSLKTWFDRHGDARPQLVNMYGITETTVHDTYRPVAGADAARAGHSRIGRPMPDLEIYVLDRDMNLMPCGVSGEMYLGGAGLARAYLNRPELTAERFVPHPFSTRAGERLYKTGDLARLLDDGDLEYLGRIDHQVKVRGYRIELGEIEAALAGHPSVGAGLVIAREDEPHDRRLTAYLVSRKQQPVPNVDELRGFLGRHLPEHMIPAHFVWLDELPLTINGKIDRRALPAPGQARPALERSYVAPRDALETLLAGMWKELLNIEHVGVEDDFFGLGGDSIKGAIFINRLQERLGEIIHVITIFQSPTIAGLSAYLKEQYAQAVGSIDGTATFTETGTDNAPTGGTPPMPPTTRPATASSTAAAPVDAAKIARLRRLIKPLPSRPASDGKRSVAGKNPPAIFVLSPPRSGSTLFRVMLAGHPKLFAPPELELLSFNTLAERRDNFSGSQSFWLEGTMRAVMEIRKCGADEAKAVMHDWEQRGLTTKECYRRLQDGIGEQRLVDKTPSYALDPSILERAEADFDHALYIHLLRHPYGMIRSFEEARLEQIFFRSAHGFTRRELAELIWLVSNENILSFLRSIPPERQHRVRFEELLERPEEALRAVCRFLKLEFAADMLQPYRDKEQRMTDGLHAQSRMLGDVKFHRYTGIDARVGNRWRAHSLDDALAGETWRVAAMCGYEREPATEKKHATAPPQGLKRIPRRAIYDGAKLPLSFAQQRLWFIHQLSPDSHAYNIPLALRLSGRLDVPALESSLGEIVKRHTALRTTFPTVDGQPMQFIAPSQPLSLPVLDLREMAEDLREERARVLAGEEARQPFDLMRGPLVRLRLLKLEAEEHVLLITMHHVVSDGWSVGVLMRELGELYRAYRTGSASPLAELPVQYADYAVWQREWLTGEALEEQLRYWREQLGGELPVLELPADRKRPAMQTFNGAVESFELSVEVGQRLREIGREHGATLFTTLLSAFKVLLYRYTGQADILVGTPIAGRNRAELENLIGFFINTLVLRTRLSGGDSFSGLLRQVKEMTHRAYRHQDVPFEKLVDELQPPRDPSQTPFFQVTFTLQDATQEAMSLEGLELGWMETGSEVAKFDLSLGMAEGDEHLTGAFVYNADIFDASTIRQLASHFALLLEGIAANPHQRLADLPLLTPEERHQLLVHWNDTQGDYPRDTPIHLLFEQQAARTPSAPAVSYPHARHSLTYFELNRRANQLAHLLRRRGLSPDTPVALLMPRSVAMMTAILAILKAGGAYLPLDTTHPAQRLRFMLADAKARFVLTESWHTPVPFAEEVEVITLDAEWENFSQESAENPVNITTARHLACVIYTSGSTGEPKGVGIEHRAVNRLVCGSDYLEMRASDRVGQVSNASFDAATFEVWGAWLHGAELVGIEREVALSPAALAREISGQQISVMLLTTALFNQMAHTEPSAFASMRCMLFGGETSEVEAVRRVLAAGKPERLVHLYGPTENTTVSTWHEVIEVEDEARTVTIGRPIRNTRAYVLDREQRLVAVGVLGELYVGGEGLARGYVHEPQQTAERFVPDAYGGEAGARLYRTGDVVRCGRDGNIEFVGRVDEQVKLRGFRVELGEIEARLREHQSVREAVVLVRKEKAGDRRLVAYLVAESGSEADAEAWRSFLKVTLPEYMIPAAFVRLDEMPLTANGKINRRALQALTPDEPERRENFVAPRDALETQLAHIWEELLNVRPVGIRENFFDLGGHSLLTVRLAAQIKKELGRELPLALILQAQTIETLAGMLRPEADAGMSSPLVAMQPRGEKTPFFCVHPAGGNVACYSGLSRQLGLDQPFYGLRASSPDVGAESAASLEKMAARYVEAVRSVQPAGPYLLGGWSMGGVVAFEMAQQLERQGQEVALLALLDSHAPHGATRAGDDDDEALLHQFTWYMGRLFGLQEWLMQEEVAETRGVEEQLRSLLAEGVRAGVVPPELGMEQVMQLFQVFRLNVRAALRYEPQPFAGRILLLRASQQLADHAPDDANGWRGLAAGGVELHLVPGDHYTMMKEPHVQVVAERLQTRLEQPVVK